MKYLSIISNIFHVKSSAASLNIQIYALSETLVSSGIEFAVNEVKN